MRSPVFAAGLVTLGLGVVVAWSVLIVPVLAMAESGPGPDIQLRLLVATPIAIASALLIVGGTYGVRSLQRAASAPGAGRVLFTGAAVLGVITALYALAILAFGG